MRLEIFRVYSKSSINGYGRVIFRVPKDESTDLKTFARAGSVSDITVTE
jgi:hypothetical protein